MNDVRLQWKRRLMWGLGGPLAAVGLCILLALLYLACRAYRQGRSDQEVVAYLLSKNPGGSAHVDTLDTWQNRLSDLLGIPKPVTDLSLKGHQVNDDDLARLELLGHLESLDLDGCPITDDGVREIAKVRTLLYLGLFGCHEITDMSFTYLGTMKSLEMLNIAGFPPKITARNIQSLSALPNLGTLHLDCCQEISDDAVEPLASLTQLDTLDIRGTSISEEGASRLERALPNTMVFTDY